MATTSKTEKTKAWRIEKTGNSTVAIYRRDKHHKPSGKTYQVFEVSAKTKTDMLPALPWKHNALRHSFISYRVADIQNVAQVALEAGNSPGMIFGHSADW
jgi:hypothetical protein